MASGLSKRVSGIESAVALLNFFHDRLLYLQPTMWSLVAAACAVPQLSELPYLTACLEGMERGVAFPESWRDAVADHAGPLGGEEELLLASLGDTLGVTDLQSQLGVLSYTRDQLEVRLKTAREDREKYHKLYSTLGVLAGVAIAIILV